MGCLIELQTNIRNDFISTEKAPTTHEGLHLFESAY